MERCPPENAERIVNAYADTVYRLAYAYAHKRADADDIFQDVFYRYFRKRPAFESSEHEKAWFLRVTVNCAKKRLSSAWRRRVGTLEDDIPFLTAEDSGLNEALSKLPAVDRSVIHLFYYEGYRAEEIGALLGLNASAVRTRLTRARRKLKAYMKEEADV